MTGNGIGCRLVKAMKCALKKILWALCFGACLFTAMAVITGIAFVLEPCSPIVQVVSVSAILFIIITLCCLE